MSDESLNLDTSILISYVEAKLPGELSDDERPVVLLEGSENTCVIGNKAESEFEGLCDRRFDLYTDLLDWLSENPEETIYEYDPVQRDIHTSDNDRSHIRLDVQFELDDRSRREQLAELRRYQQAIATVQQRTISKVLDRIYSNLQRNDTLVDALQDLEIGHDAEIVADAVAINRTADIETLVAGDSDLTGNEVAINAVIEDIEGKSVVLSIEPLSKVV
jgi:hypothetical protein